MHHRRRYSTKAGKRIILALVSSLAMTGCAYFNGAAQPSEFAQIQQKETQKPISPQEQYWAAAISGAWAGLEGIKIK
jgi:hypothetical protein